jgi:anti-anti-sigma regulatory factor
MDSAALRPIVLPAVIDLDALDGVRDQLLEAVEAGPTVLDAAGIERVATNALFLLLSAAETARRNAFLFVIARPSAALLAAIDRLGLTPTFLPLIKG